MRIESYTQVQQLYKATKSTKSDKTSKSRLSDQVHISSAGHDYQLAKKAVEAAPDVREELADSIKSRIDAGTYQVDSDSFAAKLLAKYQEMR